jgi:hypothetical protein
MLIEGREKDGGIYHGGLTQLNMVGASGPARNSPNYKFWKEGNRQIAFL